MRDSKVNRSNSVPDYLNNIQDPAEKSAMAKEAKSVVDFSDGYEKGLMKTALFENNISFVRHAKGVLEESDNGRIWEVQGEFICRRDDSNIRPIMQAISESPAMNNEEYQNRITNLIEESRNA